MLRALLIVLTVLLTVSCTAAGDLTAEETTTERNAPAGAEESAESSSPTPAPARTSSPAPTPSPSPASPSPPPEAGACRLLQRGDLDTVVNDTRRVPCSQPHTAVTYAVRKLPAGAAEGATSSGDDTVEAAAERVCSRTFAGYVGGSRADRALSSLRSTFFLPDGEQFDLGARWVRCDLYAYAHDDRLAELPGRLEGALDVPELRESLGICSRVGPDRPAFEHIICSRDHQWRAVSRVRLGADAAEFPGGRRLSRTASTECEEVVRDYLGTREGFSYGFEVPRRESWAEGDRFGFCWARTTD